jgi:hypothetical protein
MKRSDVDFVKAEMNRLGKRIEEMERLSGWTRYTKHGDEATPEKHPDDSFRGGEQVAAVKRARLDLTKALVRLRA